MDGAAVTRARRALELRKKGGAESLGSTRRVRSGLDQAVGEGGVGGEAPRVWGSRRGWSSTRATVGDCGSWGRRTGRKVSP